MQNKIKIINYLLNNNHEPVTEESFNSFITTGEYQQILKKIDELNLVYEPLLSEYNEWEKKLQPYKDFVESETKRKTEILERKKQLLFKDISLKLPTPIINAISSKSLEEKIRTILGPLDIGSLSTIELFHSEKIKKLEPKDVDLFNKILMISEQVNYLKNIGINTIDGKEIECKSEEDVNNYLNFLKRDDIRQYIPSDDLIHFITSIREKRYEEALREYHTTRKDFIDAEELVDVVNKVDYLSRNGVIAKINTSPDDEMVKEYFEQVNRAEKIYHNIDDYYDNVQNLMTSNSTGKHK